MNFLKNSLWPVLAGFIIVVFLSTFTDNLLEAAGIFPPIQDADKYVTWMLALSLGYRTLYTVLAGYITAWLTSSNKMRSVWILAVIGQAGGIMGVVAGWNLSAHWYPIAIAVFAIPSVWFGGWLKTRNG